jgi:hypothetical protein
MPNRLIKETAYELVTVSYSVPAQPARTVYERRRVCGLRYTVPGTYLAVVDPITGNATLQFTPRDPVSDGSLKGTWACTDETVLVSYPAKPARIDERLSPRPSFNLGWNSGGRSDAVFFGDGYAEFKVRDRVAGVICGLNADDGTPGSYRGNRLDFAFYLHDGQAQVIENGVVLTGAFPYTAATVFRIERTGSSAVYTMNGVTRYTNSSASTAPVWLEAALFAAYDEVLDPSIVQTGSDAPDNNMVLDLELPPLDIYFRTPGVFLEFELPALVFGFEQSLPEPSFTYFDFALPAVAFDFSLLMGTAMVLDLQLPSVKMLFADHRYAELDLVLPPLDVLFDAYEGNSNATIGAVAAARATMTSTTLLAVFMTSAGEASTAMTVTVLRDARIDASAALASVLSLSTVQDALMASVASSAAMLGVPAGAMQTLVVNLEGFGNTSYSAFDFNSFARLGNRYLGAGEAGVVELDGNSDNGVPIAAHIHLGEKDFGNVQRKTVAECYVGMAGEDSLILRVTAEGRAFSYRTRGYSDSLRQQRVDIGKGLKANYFELELFNHEGSDFEVDTLQLQVADLQRKI